MHICDPIRYTNEIHDDMLKLVYVNINTPDKIKYIIKLLIRNTIVVTKELLKPWNVPDIRLIPISSEENINK